MAPVLSRALTAAATVVPGIGIGISVFSHHSVAADLVPHVLALVAVAVGWAVVVRAPDSPVGPALAWTSAAASLVAVSDLLAASAYTSSPLPLAPLARHVWVGAWPVNLAGLLALLLVFPDGRRPGRFWAVVPWAYVGGTALMIAAMWDARQVEGAVVGDAAPWRPALGGVALVLIGGCLIAAVVSSVKQYRAGDDRRRLQMRWLLTAGAVVVVLLTGGWVAEANGASLTVAYTPFLLALVLLVPASVGLAMVRHDLFDVDRLLGAGASWLVTLVASAAIFGAVVTVLSRAIGAGSGLGPAAAAFVTALALLPLHRHLAGILGKLVDRDRFVAVAAVERFAADVRAGRRMPEEVEVVLREAQGDPELRIALARPDGWSDLHGVSVEKPLGFDLQAGGDTIAMISLGWESARARRRVADLARVAWVSIEVSRLRLVLREALDEVEASRERLVNAAATERKRLERDLHDGAQQRIIATGMRLRSLQQRLHATAAAEVDTAIGELEVTVAELRRLAHGVRPSRLDDGLGPALEGLLATSPVPVDLHVVALPETDEARTLTAYLVASEAVTNALKHARAGRIGVRLGSQGDRLTVRVSDDGVGGIPEDGLTALRDRVASVGGWVHVDSPVGGGTTVSAVV
jgi:signal transduction histidine kinase